MIEKAEKFGPKLGESIVEISAVFIQRLGIEDLVKKQAIKSGLRFHWYGDEGVDKISEFVSPTMPGKVYGYHLNRQILDEDLLQLIQEKGVDVIRPGEIIDYQKSDYQNNLKVRTSSQDLSVSSPWVVDATGRTRFTSNLFSLPYDEVNLKTSVVYTYITDPFTNNGWDNPNGQWPTEARNTADYATIHFMRDHEWWWVIKLNENTMSLGMVLDKEYHKNIDEKSHFKWRLENDEQIKKLAAGSKIGDLKQLNQLTYRANELTYKGLILLGDSGMFIDPLAGPGMEITCQQIMWISENLAKEKATGKRVSWCKYEKKFKRSFKSREASYKAGYEFMKSFSVFTSWLRNGNYVYFGWVLYPALFSYKRLKEPLQFNWVEWILFKYFAKRYKSIVKKEKAIKKHHQIKFSRVGTPKGIRFWFKPIHLLILAGADYVNLELKQLFKSKK